MGLLWSDGVIRRLGCRIAVWHPPGRHRVLEQVDGKAVDHGPVEEGSELFPEEQSSLENREVTFAVAVGAGGRAVVPQVEVEGPGLTPVRVCTSLLCSFSSTHGQKYL